jgi:deoxyribodipyrimidine photo-lyase
MKRALFLFHRDLRLPDNTSLIQAIRDGYEILPVFIFPPEQIDPKKNSYFSHPSVQFMCESLVDVDKQLQEVQSRLHLFKGQNLEVLNKIYTALPFDAIYFNQDYSKYATKRDQEIASWCTSKKISCIQQEDYGLLPLHEGLLEEKRPYLILAQYYKRVLAKHNIREVDTFSMKKGIYLKHHFSFEFPISEITSLYTETPQLAIHGGRTLGKKMLQTIRTLKHYKEERDFPALGKTTKASPHLKFGTISVREMYWTIEKLFGKDHAIIRELVFRDFYMKIYALRPELQRGIALYDALDKKVPWSYDKKLFQAWTDGKTGYPLVDAGMQELNITGHQHNRIRMLCGSVLTKYFLIDWRWGLKYYYTHLVDADIYSNTAGWGFVSSTGPDGVPYFRAPFNPFIQSKKFDKEAVYIKKWIPALEKVAAKDIHHWFDPMVRAKYPDVSYPAPVIDHKEASARALTVFKKAFAEKYN